MRVRVSFFALLLFVGCGDTRSPAAFTPPASVGGEWTLSESVPITGNEVPASGREAGVLEAIRVRYDGPEPLVVSFYRMPTGSGAFEMMQHWQPAAGKLATYSGSWFVELEAPGLDQHRLNALADDVEHALTGG